MRAWIKRLAIATAAALAACLPARAEPMFASVSLNGADTGAVVSFERSGSALFAPWRELKRLGVQVEPPAGANAASPAELGRIPGLKYTIDDQAQAVALQAAPELLPKRTLGPEPRGYAQPDRAAWGAAMDYAVNIQGKAGWAGGQARVFGPVGVLSHGFITMATPRGVSYRRLETNLVLDDYARGRSLTIGDFVSTSPSGRTVRAAGLRLASDAGLRPDLFSQPLIDIPGEAASPSTVELFVDGARRYRTTVDPGRFDLRAPPTVNSRGELALVVTDALGRQTVTTRPFYTSSDLLRPGALDYALDAGWLREGYSTSDDRYREAFAAVSVRRGMTNALTLDGHAEATGRFRAAGGGMTAALAHEILMSAAFDVSDTAAGTGTRLRVSARREAALFGLWATYERRSGGFRELGRRAGDTPGEDLQVGGSVRDDRLGGFSISHTRRRVQDTRYALTTAAWSSQLGRLNLFASATLARDRYGGRTASIGFVAPLGARGGLASGGFDSGGGGRVNAQWAQPPPDDQGLGWRANGERSLRGGQMRGEGEVRYLTPAGEAALGVAADGRGASLRAYASGSVIWLGGRARVARTSGEGLALVETGEPDVQLMVENRPSGRTGPDGSLLLVNLPAQAQTRIGIAAETVDLSATYATDEAVVRPHRRGAVRVSLPVRHVANAQAQIFDARGDPLPVGSTVRLNGRPAGVVGFDSWIYLEDLRTENVIEIDLAEGVCQLRITLAAPPTGGLPQQTCDLVASRGLRRVRLDGPESGPGGVELLGDDGSGGVRRLSVLRLQPENGPRRGEDDLHLQRPGLRRVLVQLERTVRWLGFGDGAAHDPGWRQRDAQLSALR